MHLEQDKLVASEHLNNHGSGCIRTKFCIMSEHPRLPEWPGLEGASGRGPVPAGWSLLARLGFAEQLCKAEQRPATRVLRSRRVCSAVSLPGWPGEPGVLTVRWSQLHTRAGGVCHITGAEE